MEEDLYSMSSEQLWNLYRQFADENTKAYKNIKEGIYLTIPIYYFTNQWYQLFPDTKTAIIKGHGQIKIDLFMKEKEERDKLMREEIINQENQGIDEERVKI